MHPVCLLSRNYNAQQLVTERPPVFMDRNKQVVFAIACPPGCKHGGELHYSRWQAMELPEQLHPEQWRTEIAIQPNSFSYEPVQQTGLLEWHLNFANWDLFSEYGSSLLAQDEHQVVEHPALASLRHALRAEDLEFGTNGYDGPTPVLIRNVERRCILDTRPSQDAPDGLYGNRFSVADPQVVARAVTALHPPTLSNILAIEAPMPRTGEYTAEVLRLVLLTAYSGFTAARYESQVNASAQSVAIHTGFWGCGAYGGNRVVMTLLQMIAANMAAIDRLIFHTVEPSGMEPVQQAKACLQDIVARNRHISTDGLIDAVLAHEFVWGESDGN